MTTTQSVAALNAVTSALRNTQAPMSQPVNAAPVAITVPRHLATISVDATTEAQCRAFVREFGVAMLKADHALARAQDVAAWFVGKVFGDTSPTYARYMEIRKELRVACELGHGAHVFDTVRKAYAAAIVTRYGALPVSDSPEAARKAAARAAAAKPAGRPVGATGTDAKLAKGVATPADTIGQMIAKFGPAAVLVELAAILATEKATVPDAHVLADIATHYKKLAA